MKIDIAAIGKSLTDFASKNRPEILIAIGLSGMVTSLIFMRKETPKIVEEKEEIREAKVEECGEEPTKWEYLKGTWKHYIPSVGTFALSAACIICANTEHLKQNAALATAYTLSESALTEYKSKVVETLGEKADEQVQNAVAQDRVDKTPLKRNEIIVTGKGETLCLDPLMGRYFWSDMATIKEVRNEINRRLISEQEVSLNEFYYELGLPSADLGEELGWNVNEGFVDISFGSALKDGTPCLVVNHNTHPRAIFMR